MSDIGRDRTMGDEDRLPWLEPVEEVDEAEGPSALKLVLAVVVALIAIALVVGGVVWLRGRAGDDAGTPGVIAAPEGDYKVRPGDPGGMQVEGQGDASYAASDGADPNAPIDLSAVPETPVTDGQGVTVADAAVGTVKLPPSTPPSAAPQPKLNPKPAPPAAKPAPAALPSVADPAPRPVTATPAPAPVAAPRTGGGGTVQLGAFSSEAKANAAWSSLAGRFGFLGSLSKAVVPVQSGGKTLYRLRASGGDASVCGKLKVAGESCTVVN